LSTRIAGGIRKIKKEKDEKIKPRRKPATERKPCGGT
jgi:hypothetical protein